MKNTKVMAVVMGVCLILALVATPTQAKVLKLRLQTSVVPEDVKRLFPPFIDAVKKMTGGQIEITPYPVGALVPTSELLEAVGSGMIEMGSYAEGYWSGVVPVSEIAGGVPFGFRNYNEGREFMWDKGFVEILRQAYEKHNVYVIPNEFASTGLMTKKPITKIEDFKGLKLRAYGTMAKWLTKLGASTTYIPGPELYSALATGVVDGAHWADAGPMYIMKFQEVLKYYMMPEPITAWTRSLQINLDIWKGLSSEQRAIIEAATQGYLGLKGFDNTRMLSERALNSMVKDWGVNVVTLPDSEQEKLRMVGKEVMEDLAKKDPLNAQVISMLKNYFAELGR